MEIREADIAAMGVTELEELIDRAVRPDVPLRVLFAALDRYTELQRPALDDEPAPAEAAPAATPATTPVPAPTPPPTAPPAASPKAAAGPGAMPGGLVLPVAPRTAAPAGAAGPPGPPGPPE